MSLKALQIQSRQVRNGRHIRPRQLNNQNIGNNNHILNLQRIDIRRFAGDDQVYYPKVFQNVFNKRVSRDGKRVYYTVFPFDYNEPWPFPPVYDKETGADLNRDPMWGVDGEAPPCSITGKPRRALGHYPWLGRPIVPLDDNKRYIMDDQVAPYPFFNFGRFESNRLYWMSWISYFVIFGAIWYFVDVIWRGDGPWGNLSNQRDELFFKEQMCSTAGAYQPIGQYYYGNPLAPWRRNLGTETYQINHKYIKGRFDMVFVPPAQEDYFPEDENVNYFKLPGYNC